MILQSPKWGLPVGGIAVGVVVPAIVARVAAVLAPVLSVLIPGVTSVLAPLMAGIDDGNPVGRPAGRAYDHHIARMVRRGVDHDRPGRGRAIGAGDHHWAVGRVGRARVVVNHVAAIVIVGDRSEEQPGGGTDQGTFGRVVVVVLSNDRTGDAAEDHVAGRVVAGVGGGCHGQGGRAGEGEKKASFHTSAETWSS